MGLAPMLVDQIFSIVAGLKRQGITVLLVEQNAYAALSLIDLPGGWARTDIAAVDGLEAAKDRAKAGVTKTYCQMPVP